MGYGAAIGKGRGNRGGGKKQCTCEDSHQLGGGAMESGPDQLQAHDVLGVNLGGRLHTHALQVPISFFRGSWGMEWVRGCMRVG